MKKIISFLNSDSSVAKNLKILGYLLISGVLGLLAAEVARDEKLVVVFAPAINYALWLIEQQIKK